MTPAVGYVLPPALVDKFRVTHACCGSAGDKRSPPIRRTSKRRVTEGACSRSVPAGGSCDHHGLSPNTLSSAASPRCARRGRALSWRSYFLNQFDVSIDCVKTSARAGVPAAIRRPAVAAAGRSAAASTAGFIQRLVIAASAR